MYEYRCDERLKAKAEGSTRLAYTGLRGGLEHLKTETRYSEAAGEGEEGGAGGGRRRLNTESKEETKVTQHKLEVFESKEKGEAVEKRERPLSEGAGT
jgi:hypothetical protein